MIITELNDQVEGEMDALVRQGITSFKLFMAYPGVLIVDDRADLQALQRSAQSGGTDHLHARRERGRDRRLLVQRAIAKPRRSKYHGLTRPAVAEAEGTHRAIALARPPDAPLSHRAPLVPSARSRRSTEARDR